MAINKELLISIKLYLILFYSIGVLAQPVADTTNGIVPIEIFDSKFEFEWKKDAPILFGSAALMIAGEVMKHTVDPLTDEQISNLNRNDINAFDRRATYQNRVSHGIASDITLGVAVISPLSLLLSKPIRNDYLPILAMFFETGAVVNGLTSLSKGLTHRIRPYVYNPDIPTSDKLDLNARHSFWSGHVSNTAAFSVLTAYMVSRYSDNDLLKIFAWSGAVAVPGTVAVLRYTAGKHYPSDVIVGYLVGSATGLLIPLTHLKQLPEDSSWDIEVSPYPGGISFTYKF